MAQGGKTIESSSFFHVETVRDRMRKEIEKLKKAMKSANPKQKDEIQKLIAAKREGIKATKLTMYDKFKYRKGDYRNPIPTLQGTKEDDESKKKTAAYLKTQAVLKKEDKREKGMKKGGIVKSHRGDGIAKRGRTKGRII